MMLGKCQCQVVLLISVTVGKGPFVLAAGASGVGLDMFFSRLQSL